MTAADRIRSAARQEIDWLDAEIAGLLDPRRAATEPRAAEATRHRLRMLREELEEALDLLRRLER